jgi:hypothetical protein
VSRRKRSAADRAATSGGKPGGRAAAATGPGGPAADAAERRARGVERPWPRRMAVDVAILIAVFAVTVGIAELAGAANLGVALGVGQVAFAIALVALLIRE